MIIIGVDFHPEFQQIASVDTDTGEFQEQQLTHREEAENFYRGLQLRARRYVLEWRPAGMPAGSNDCWPSCSLSCGSEMQPRFEPSEFGSGRPIARMRS